MPRRTTATPAHADLAIDPAPDPRQVLAHRRSAETLRAAILNAKLHELLVRHGTACLYVRGYPKHVVAAVEASYRAVGWSVKVKEPWIRVDAPGATRAKTAR